MIETQRQAFSKYEHVYTHLEENVRNLLFSFFFRIMFSEFANMISREIERKSATDEDTE